LDRYKTHIKIEKGKACDSKIKKGSKRSLIIEPDGKNHGENEC
jgi:hypothetical protein